MRKLTHTIALIFAAQFTAVSAVEAQESFAIQPDQSVFAVVTHPGGVLSTLAHSHFIYANTYTADLMYRGNDITKFSFTAPVQQLVVDHPVVKATWEPRLMASGAIKKRFDNVSSKDRKKIHAEMVSPGQLDANQFPELSVVSTRVDHEPGKRGDWPFTHLVTLDVTIHGKTVSQEFPAAIVRKGNSLTAEAVGQLRFTDFGIKPYRGGVGTIRNKDEFFIYVYFVAKKK